MSTLTLVPVSRNSGTAISAPVSSVAGLVPPGRAVALQARLGVRDLEHDRRGQLDEQDGAVVAGHDGLLVLEHVLRRIADDLGGHRDLVVGVAVHEDEVGAVVVEVLHVPLVDVRRLDLDAGVEGLVDDLAAQDVLQLGPHEGRALAGLDVLELDDGPQLALEVEDEAVLEVVGRCHGWIFAFVDVGGRTALEGRRHPGEGWGTARVYRAGTPPPSRTQRRTGSSPRLGAQVVARTTTSAPNRVVPPLGPVTCLRSRSSGSRRKPEPTSPVTVASWWMPPSSPKTMSRVSEVRVEVGRARRVGRAVRVHGLARRLGEGDLARLDDLTVTRGLGGAAVDLEVDVRPPAVVAAREDRGEARRAGVIGRLHPPQVVLVLHPLGVHRVPALAHPRATRRPRPRASRQSRSRSRAP